MQIGCPREVKAQEYRVGITPAAAREAVAHGHQVLVEAGAGEGAGFTDEEYAAVGAEIVDAEAVFARAELIVKVKEPQAGSGAAAAGTGAVHLSAPRAGPADARPDGVRVTAIAYETVTRRGGLPLLAPMWRWPAGWRRRWARTLQKAHGGRGVLLGGVPGVPPAEWR